LSPLLRFLKERDFAVCGRQNKPTTALRFSFIRENMKKILHRVNQRFVHAARGVPPHTSPPSHRRAKLFVSHELPFERIYKDFAQRWKRFAHATRARGGGRLKKGGIFVYETLEQLKADCLSCADCPLCETRQNVVFGVGVPQAEVLFIGEGPGENEDIQGEPFVGRGG